MPWTHKNPTKACSLQPEDQERRRLARRNFQTTLQSKAPQERPDPRPSQASKSQVESLGFHPWEAGMRYSTPPLGYNRGQLGSWNFHPCQSMTGLPLSKQRLQRKCVTHPELTGHWGDVRGRPADFRQVTPTTMLLEFTGTTSVMAQW